MHRTKFDGPAVEEQLFLRNYRELREVQTKACEWLAKLWTDVEATINNEEKNEFRIFEGTWRVDPMTISANAQKPGAGTLAHFGVRVRLEPAQSDEVLGEFLTKRNIVLSVEATDVRGDDKTTSGSEIRLLAWAGNAANHKAVAEHVGTDSWLTQRSKLLSVHDRRDLRRYAKLGDLTGDVFERYLQLGLDGNDVSRVVDAIREACCVGWPSLWAAKADLHGERLPAR